MNRVQNDLHYSLKNKSTNNKNNIFQNNDSQKDSSKENQTADKHDKFNKALNSILKYKTIPNSSKMYLMNSKNNKKQKAKIKSIYNLTTKSTAGQASTELSSIDLLKIINKNLTKYNSSLDKYYKRITTNIMYDENYHYVTVFKDYLYWDDENEFLKRFYHKEEMNFKFKTIFDYYEHSFKSYKLYSIYYDLGDCNKVMRRLYKKKRNILDALNEKSEEEEEEEEDKEKSPKKKYSTIFKSYLNASKNTNLLSMSETISKITLVDENNNLFSNNIPLRNKIKTLFKKEENKPKGRNKNRENIYPSQYTNTHKRGDVKINDLEINQEDNQSMEIKTIDDIINGLNDNKQTKTINKTNENKSRKDTPNKNTPLSKNKIYQKIQKTYTSNGNNRNTTGKMIYRTNTKTGVVSVAVSLNSKGKGNKKEEVPKKEVVEKYINKINYKPKPVIKPNLLLKSNNYGINFDLKTARVSINKNFMSTKASGKSIKKIENFDFNLNTDLTPSNPKNNSKCTTIKSVNNKLKVENITKNLIKKVPPLKLDGFPFLSRNVSSNKHFQTIAENTVTSSNVPHYTKVALTERNQKEIYMEKRNINLMRHLNHKTPIGSFINENNNQNISERCSQYLNQLKNTFNTTTLSKKTKGVIQYNKRNDTLTSTLTKSRFGIKTQPHSIDKNSNKNYYSLNTSSNKVSTKRRINLIKQI